MFKNLLKQILLASTLAFAVAGTANATLIKQDILFDDLFDDQEGFYQVIGSVTVDVRKSEVWDPDTNIATQWEDFSLFGFEFFTEQDAIDYGVYFGIFEAIFNPNDLYAGFSSVQFDVQENLFEFYVFSGAADVVPDFNYLVDVFDENGGLYVAGNIALGDVSVVPVPATLVLFITALFALARRRV